MGGISKSYSLWADDTFHFRGDLSRKSNGGFASVVSSSIDTPKDIALTKGIQIRFLSDSRIYKIRFRSLANSQGVWQQTEIPGSRDLRELKILWSEFSPHWRGQFQPDEPRLKPEEITGMSLLTSDGKEGHFRLEIKGFRFLR